MQFTAEFSIDKISMGTLPDKRFYRFTLTTEPCVRTCEDCRPRVHNYAVTHCEGHYPFRFETRTGGTQKTTSRVFTDSEPRSHVRRSNGLVRYFRTLHSGYAAGVVTKDLGPGIVFRMNLRNC
jgi:hypothetical protein